MLVPGILAKLGLCLIFPILKADFGMILSGELNAKDHVYIYRVRGEGSEK